MRRLSRLVNEACEVRDKDKRRRDQLLESEATTKLDYKWNKLCNENTPAAKKSLDDKWNDLFSQYEKAYNTQD